MLPENGKFVTQPKIKVDESQQVIEGCYTCCKQKFNANPPFSVIG